MIADGRGCCWPRSAADRERRDCVSSGAAASRPHAAGPRVLAARSTSVGATLPALVEHGVDCRLGRRRAPESCRTAPAAGPRRLRHRHAARHVHESLALDATRGHIINVTGFGRSIHFGSCSTWSRRSISPCLEASGAKRRTWAGFVRGRSSALHLTWYFVIQYVY